MSRLWTRSLYTAGMRRRPNVLVVMDDQHQREALGVAGRRGLSTWHLDAGRFVSYASVLDGSALPRLADRLGVDALPTERIDRGLRRQSSDGDLDHEAADVHAQLEQAA